MLFQGVHYRHTLLPAISQCRLASSTRDGPSDSIVVYEGPLTRQIKAVRLFSLITSVSGIAAQPFLIKEVAALNSMPAAVALLGTIGFFTLVTPVLLHLVTKKYVTELCYDANSSKYTATVLSFFVRKKPVTFTPEDVIVPDVPGMFTSFKASGVPLFVDPKLFDDPEHYVKIMGYDKPIDFKLKSHDDRTAAK
ncbi:hypothetical protein PR048_003236 [Dryococelus australis]|uniref:Transmembrane protein 70 n=1 Tax=Dryococelus australis TaxID=614101 RepID=A0ABQ9INU4_9NEOP|nr:hypothetical protein PR048_003236 [Dryococelus australis]